MDLWTSIAAPIVVGVVLWGIAEWVRFISTRRRDNRRRRRQIVSNLVRADLLLKNAMRDGSYDDAYIADSMRPLARLRDRYEQLTAETLDLFEPGEEHVAFWVSVEFYAAFHDPLVRMKDGGVDRERRADGVPLAHPHGNYYLAPRHDMLLEWSLWRAIGPNYGHRFQMGDRARHNVVVPNSDSAVGLLRPPIWLDAARSFAPPRRRFWQKQQIFTYQDGRVDSL